MKLGKEIWNDPQARDEYVDTMLWDSDLFSKKFYHLEYADLPDWIKLGMETHPKKGIVITERTIGERVWAPGDTYLVVPEIQVMHIGGFNKGDKVKVTIENIQSSVSSMRNPE